ncbi:hypothetical protein PASE110613_16980 [Paenibacillus sediminis]|uniref:Uncharacterized protein n=1 Tax=Paenibacillus sediminis TaxID=664909 RepID=A0ABS4H3N2_9BACL|nr:hypothetical protein [Paenibacillus sediminis]MBP1936892.1 hypothetical protein [Paenibacillus sediminis]
MSMQRHGRMAWRLEIGQYVLRKLASAGLIYGLFSMADSLAPGLFYSFTREDVSIEQSVYAYGLIGALIVDALIVLLPKLRIDQECALYVSAGFVLFACGGTNEAGEISWLNGILGLIMLALFYIGRLRFRRESFILLIFAFIIPLIFMEWYSLFV